MGATKRTMIELMVARRLTASELAEQLQVHPATVGGWIAGNWKPRRATFERLCEILQVSPDEIDLEPANQQKDPETRRNISQAMKESWQKRKERWARLEALEARYQDELEPTGT